MTLATRQVRFAPLRLDGVGAPTVASGYYLIEPTSAYDDGAGRVERIPLQVTISGAPVTVDLPVTPADHAWALKVSGVFANGAGRISTEDYVAVPAGETVAEFENLQRLNPGDLDPLAVPEAAWWAALELASMTPGPAGPAGPTGATGPAGSGTAEYQLVTVGLTGSGAMSICDGTADDVQIQAAINTVATAGGGIVRIYSGVYEIRAMITVPKDPKIRVEGQYTTKSGFGGTTLQAWSGLGTNLAAIIKEAGTAPAVTSNADHSHASHYDRLIFDGLTNADAGLLLLNTDHTIVSNCKFVGVTIGVDGQYDGTVSASDYAGGLRVQASSFLASSIGIRLNSHTQDWITDSWFLGGPSSCHIQFICCNKIHLSNNEFNTVGGSCFIFDDTVALHCGDINVTGGFINAGSGKPFWTDNRTNTNGKGVIVSGVRTVSGVTTKLFQQAKAYQGVTYTSANRVGGFIVPDWADEVILINAAGGTMPVQLPTAATAVKNIWIKAISVTNAATILPFGAETIEQAGVLGSVFTFTEVNESVLLTPDSNKWRVLEDQKPSILAGGKRVGTVASGTTITPTGDTADVYTVTALAAAATVAAPSGTPVNGQRLVLRLKDNATARALTWNAIYRAIGVTLPTTTVVSKTTYLTFYYNSADTKWDAIMAVTEA